MPGMHFSVTSRRAYEASDQTLPQPHAHHYYRQLEETLTSITNSDQDNVSKRLLSQATTPNNQITQEQPLALATSHLRLHTKLRLNPGPPPMRDLPLLRKAGEAVHSHCTLVPTNQLTEVSSDVEMPSSPLDSFIGGPYASIYGVGLPYAMHEKAQALAEAEEAEYQSKRAWKRGAKLTGRMGSLFKDLSDHGVAWRTRSSIR